MTGPAAWVEDAAAASGPLAAALMAADTPIILTNPRLPDNPIIAANPAFCALSGYAPEDLLGRNCRFLQCEETDPRTVDRLRAAIAAAEPVEVVIYNRRRDGERFWNRLLVAPIFDPTGQVIFFFANQRDVTAEYDEAVAKDGRSDALEVELVRRAAEEQRMRESQRAAGAASWDWDLLTDEIGWSAGYQEVIGAASSGTPNFEGWLARILPEDLGRARAGADAIRAGVGRFEYRIQRGGEIHWMESIGRLVARDPAGRPARATGIVIDVTERKAAEARARASEVLFRAVSEASPIIVFVTDAVGRNTYVSPQFTTYTGLPQEALLGDGWMDVMAPEDREPVLAASQRSIAAGADHEVELRMRRHDGVWRWFMVRSVPLRDGLTQHVTGWCGTVADIQEQVEAREALARSRTELERLIDERTMALTEALEALRFEATERARVEEALRQAQKMEAIGQLTGGIAHDFNNLLGVISGSLDLLQVRLAKSVGDAGVVPFSRYIDAARRGVDRGTSLTQRLLAFARRQSLVSGPVEADRLVGDMAELIERAVGPQIAVRMRLGSGPVVAFCDAHQLEAAVLNLSINARDAMPSGGTLSLTTAARTIGSEANSGRLDVPAGHYVEVAVTDTGHGMSPEVRQRAFDPFFTTKPVGQGTGLGLSQTYGFVRQSHGFVLLESEEGQGTTVRLLLPRHEPPASDEPEQPAPNLAVTPAGARVLVVEDEETLRELLSEALVELGWQVLSAADGERGLEIVRSAEALDLLVTDVGLPGLNGRRLAEAARAARPALPILLITGYAGDALADLAEGAGLPPGIEVIGKPFTLAALAARLSQMIGAGTRSAAS